jgi:hypothetical protein
MQPGVNWNSFLVLKSEQETSNDTLRLCRLTALVAIVEPAEVLAAIAALKKLPLQRVGTVGGVSNEDGDAGCGHGSPP